MKAPFKQRVNKVSALETSFSGVGACSRMSETRYITEIVYCKFRDSKKDSSEPSKTRVVSSV